LESLGEEPGFELRPTQLAIISSLLKAKSDIEISLAFQNQGQGQGVEIIGGLVGGDMNSISDLDNSSHKLPEMALRDV
jgi:hypothetical protein